MVDLPRMLFPILMSGFVVAADVLVTVPNGQIRGVLTQSQVNESRFYYSYLGVRYAKPPVGDLRFKPAAELDPWTDVYDATYEKNICYQVTADYDSESEDCLFMNIFTPQSPNQNSTLLPVFFFIHGGGFVEGSGYISGGTGPDFFMDYDVIFVAINYRLGPFGFLSTGDSVIPGNLGLKDQNFALKWIQKNIQYFGGDPNRVTISGQSAGSASVSYQLLSPQSAGLFQAAILESGTAITPWAYQRDQVEITFQTASLINSTFTSNKDSSELLSFLLQAEAKDIDAASFNMISTESPANLQITQGFHYAPVIEVESDEAFISKPMYELFQSGEYNKVPIILGFNAEEAMFMINSDSIDASRKGFDQFPEYLVPFGMHLTNEENKTTAGQAIKSFYTQDEADFESSLPSIIRYFSDQCFGRSIMKTAELQSQHSDVYFYYFTYHGRMGGNTLELAGTGNVTHGEEQNYLLTRGTFNTDLTQFSEDDRTTHYSIMSIWTNFIKTQNPIPEQNELFSVEWPAVNLTRDGGIKYLDIGKNLNIRTNPKNKVYQFWNKLYDQYGILPYDTY